MLIVTFREKKKSYDIIKKTLADIYSSHLQANAIKKNLENNDINIYYIHTCNKHISFLPFNLL